ncbi:hypothetical protein [Exiguobacterium sp. s133]|uniref:hypothetical protein n=1 Tax=Exiguobacterium sp. s133 TaxID=2751213 RepID=UPI001BE73A10|nr:hypothetical protein [Exiguobacterium sp. s133]
MRLLDLLLEIDPSFSDTLNDERYPYSKNIIRKRIESNLDQKQFAQKLNVNFETFLNLESCNLDIEIELYREVSDKADKITI